MLHLRVIVPDDEWDDVVVWLRAHDGVVHLVDDAGTSAKPRGRVVVCDVAREAGNDVIEWLQDRGIHQRGAIVVVALDTSVSDAAAEASRRTPGSGGDALIWETLEDRVRDDSALTMSFLIFIVAAAVIAAIGIMLDSTILVIGAMVAGPDYGPLAGMCVGLVRRRRRPFLTAARTAAIGLAAGVVGALTISIVLRAVGLGPENYDLGDRQLTAFISRPDALAAIVAIVAGVIGMLAFAEEHSTALLGVLVSATTIPAVGNAGLALAYGAWSELGGALAQLAINVTGLVAAGATTLALHARFTGSRAERPLPPPATSSTLAP